MRGEIRLVLRLIACFLGSRQLLVIALHWVGRDRLVLRLVTCFLGSRQLLVIALHWMGRGRLVACFPVPLGDPIYSVTGRKVCAGPNRALVVFLVLK